MKIEIIEPVGCWPNDGKAYVEFKAGDQPEGLTPEYAAILVAKGHAREVKATAAKPTAPATTPPAPAEPAKTTTKTEK